MPLPCVNPAMASRKTTLITVPTTMNGRRRPNRLFEWSERAPASGVSTSENAAPIGGISPLKSSLCASPTMAAI